MTDRQGNQIKLYYSEREAYSIAKTFLDEPELQKTKAEGDLSTLLLITLER